MCDLFSLVTIQGNSSLSQVQSFYSTLGWHSEKNLNLESLSKLCLSWAVWPWTSTWLHWARVCNLENRSNNISLICNQDLPAQVMLPRIVPLKHNNASIWEKHLTGDSSLDFLGALQRSLIIRKGRQREPLSTSLGCGLFGWTESLFQSEETRRGHTGSPQDGAKMKEQNKRPILLSAAWQLGF